MKAIIKVNRNNQIFILSLFCLLWLGCEDFVTIDDPKGQIFHDEVFNNEATATAAITTLYGTLRDNVLLTGNQYGLNTLMGFYADELDYYGAPGQPVDAFYRHQILASNAVVKTLWDSSYNLIYMSNSALEGIEASEQLPIEAKQQLKGEALFVRALTHFYLTNIFGAIPYITTTNYVANQDAARMDTELVYESLLNDLNSAKNLLTESYVGGERIRANTYAVSALMARIYLYRQMWEEAETESSLIINTSSLFGLETVENEFLKESTSAILQLKPKNEGDPTHEASSFIFTSGPPVIMALSPQFVESFTTNDLRRQNWVLEVADGNEIWYAPNKYKYYETTSTSMEYSIVLRLAEQYLIRSEARAHLGDLSGAAHDLDMIRNRAGLPNTGAVSEMDLLQGILDERRFELFTEQGHRWFDLKRLGQAEPILSSIKPNWRGTDVLFPIPELELSTNPYLAPQNPGY